VKRQEKMPSISLSELGHPKPPLEMVISRRKNPRGSAPRPTSELALGVLGNALIVVPKETERGNASFRASPHRALYN
jgi:hypothetical protein